MGALISAFGELCRGDQQADQTKEVATALIECLGDADPNISYWSAYALCRINESAKSRAACVLLSPYLPPSTVAKPPVAEPAPRPGRGDLVPAARPDRAPARPRQIDDEGWQPARD